MYIHMYIYIYMYTYIYTHTNIYIYMYIYILFTTVSSIPPVPGARRRSARSAQERWRLQDVRGALIDLLSPSLCIAIPYPYNRGLNPLYLALIQTFPSVSLRERLRGRALCVAPHASADVASAAWSGRALAVGVKRGLDVCLTFGLG